MDWIAIVAGVWVVAIALYLPRWACGTRARIIERGADTDRWDALMPKVVRVWRPVLLLAGVAAILSGVF